MFVDRNTHGRHGGQHLGADFSAVVDRCYREVAAFLAGPVGQVAVVVVGAAVIGAFLGIKAVKAVMRIRREAHTVEDKELWLGPEIGGVADP